MLCAGGFPSWCAGHTNTYDDIDIYVRCGHTLQQKKNTDKFWQSFADFHEQFSNPIVKGSILSLTVNQKDYQLIEVRTSHIHCNWYIYIVSTNYCYNSLSFFRYHFWKLWHQYQIMKWKWSICSLFMSLHNMTCLFAGLD